MRTIAATALLMLTSQVANAQRPATPGRATVHATREADRSDLRLTINADQVDLRLLMELIVRKVNEQSPLERDLVGFNNIARVPVVDVYLVDRPWKDALRWVLGSAGLSAQVRANSIEVREEISPTPTSSELDYTAVNAWLHVVANQPDHPEGDAHQMALAAAFVGSDETFRGAAIMQYEVVIDDFPDSDLRPDAMLRSAELYSAIGDHGSAALRLSDLCDLPEDHEHHALARRELVRNLCHLGEAEQDDVLRNETAERALHTLGALDQGWPARLAVERRERALLRAWALTLTNRPIDALRTLDLAATYSDEGQRDVELLVIRARALSRGQRHGEAANCWLRIADQRQGDLRTQALVAAAQQALVAGQELGALAITSIGESEGLRELEPYAREAQSRLGILGGATGLDARQLLIRGVDQASHGRNDEAISSFRRAWLKRQQLTQDQLQALALAHATALDADGLHDESHTILRVAATEILTTAQRSPLYRLAAQLLEARGEFDRALNAITGEL